ncbi:MAG: DUF523 and DUF1722 domain-containing protein [Desulfomonile sp.]|nr:DUF523 and DUF1722 domain-containing protein [Desulfomonile sp.]
MDTRLRIGVSSCLLGENVRYDGGNRLDWFIVGTLARFVDFVPVCPEVELGLGVPREPLHLKGNPAAPRLVTKLTRVDYTDRMLKWAQSRVKDLESERLSGFIFKSRSPSSGMRRVKVHSDEGITKRSGIGLFARAFMEHFPTIPVEDEEHLHDPAARENFIEAIFVLRRWRMIIQDRLSRDALIDFHSRHDFILRSHGLAHYGRLSRLIAATKEYPIQSLCNQYQVHLFEALRSASTVKRNTKVLRLCLTYLRKELSHEEKHELMGVIEDYRQGRLPLLVPLTLIAHYAGRYDRPYLKQQYYLYRDPLELRLRSHA